MVIDPSSIGDGRQLAMPWDLVDRRNSGSERRNFQIDGEQRSNECKSKWSVHDASILFFCWSLISWQMTLVWDGMEAQSTRIHTQPGIEVQKLLESFHTQTNESREQPSRRISRCDTLLYFQAVLLVGPFTNHTELMFSYSNHAKWMLV